MLVLGLQGSPRKNGNSDILLSEFMDEAKKLGTETVIVDADKRSIEPCREYVLCERKGICPIEDDMKEDIYHLIQKADIIIMASPIFFYNVTAQLKALIDRSQVFWARNYLFKMKDPGSKWKKGFLLSVGATSGKTLFDGSIATAKYFYDAVGANFAGSLTYKRIEKKGDIKNHPTAIDDVRKKAAELIKPFLNRKKILFACRQNAGRSQMSSAFSQFYGGDRIEALRGGSEPAEKINPIMVDVMMEKGIDVGFRKPQSIENAIKFSKPDIIMTMGCGEACPFVPGAEIIDWEIPDPAGNSIEFVRNVRDDIEKRVLELIETLK